MTVRRYGARPISRLNPTMSFQGVQYVMLFQELASVPPTAIGDRVGSLAARREELIAALDLLFTGM